MTQVYLYQDGQQVGPYELEALQSWIQSGQLQPTEPAWFEGCPGWVTLAEVPGIILQYSSSWAAKHDLDEFIFSPAVSSFSNTVSNCLRCSSNDPFFIIKRSLIYART